MQYSKPMIDLVYEIRRRVDATMKPGVKLANPDMLDELIDYYHASKDAVTKALIKELFFLAGDNWPDRLIAPAQAEAPKQTVMVYRGQIRLVETSPETPTTPTKPQGIYRGQVIDL